MIVSLGEGIGKGVKAAYRGVCERLQRGLGCGRGVRPAFPADDPRFASVAKGDGGRELVLGILESCTASSLG